MTDTSAAARPSPETVWAWLAELPDPEIPVISLVDLGIIRDVTWQKDCLEVTVTPTYSGCPATTVISLEIEQALRDHGVEKFALKRQIAPAWTTDWISQAGRDKLRAYGIAPPEEGAPCSGLMTAEAPKIACPRCGSRASERISQFGSTPCKASYRCSDCLEPFDYFKPF
ncbi:MAG: phenylacetate-CoA oxygenase subunit PaaJ [Rhodospirillales bacterium]